MSHQPDKQDKRAIVGKHHELDESEAQSITNMILEAQGSERQLVIPESDLDEHATTAMSTATAAIVDQSRVVEILRKFNRDYLYGLGRFDEYDRGVLLKWGDGYSRKHIWVTVEGDDLLFETSHVRTCGKPYCESGHHRLTPSLWKDVRVINAELADQFKYPVYERSED